MPDQATSGTDRLQYDKQGKVIGRLIKLPEGHSLLSLDIGYVLVKMQDTGRVRIWNTKTRQLVEFM
jgi:hypothetical protein